MIIVVGGRTGSGRGEAVKEREVVDLKSWRNLLDDNILKKNLHARERETEMGKEKTVFTVTHLSV